MGSGSGSGRHPWSCSSPRRLQASISALGLPPVEPSSAFRTDSTGSSPNCWRSRVLAWAWLSPSRRCSGTGTASSGESTWGVSRRASTRATGRSRQLVGHRLGHDVGKPAGKQVAVVDGDQERRLGLVIELGEGAGGRLDPDGQLFGRELDRPLAPAAPPGPGRCSAARRLAGATPWAVRRARRGRSRAGGRRRSRSPAETVASMSALLPTPGSPRRTTALPEPARAFHKMWSRCASSRLRATSPPASSVRASMRSRPRPGERSRVGSTDRSASVPSAGSVSIGPSVCRSASLGRSLFPTHRLVVVRSQVAVARMQGHRRLLTPASRSFDSQKSVPLMGRA